MLCRNGKSRDDTRCLGMPGIVAAHVREPVRSGRVQMKPGRRRLLQGNLLWSEHTVETPYGKILSTITPEVLVGRWAIIIVIRG